MPESLRPTFDRFLSAYDDLVVLGEEVEDEWSYVNDLAATWRARLSELADRRGDELLAPNVIAAVDQLIAEVSLIGDPHRAIDWLSTAPQIVALAAGEEP
jgi:hypothetical protein